MDEDEYRRKFEEVNKKISDPKISKKIDNFLKKIAELVDCNVELNFSITPHIEEYAEMQASDDFIIPDAPTMKLQDLIEHLRKEEGNNFDVYIDPIYLNDGVNEIIDVLISNVDNKLIVVPISNKKQVKL